MTVVTILSPPTARVNRGERMHVSAHQACRGQARQEAALVTLEECGALEMYSGGRNGHFSELRPESLRSEGMQAWALVQAGGREALDVFLSREEAEDALADRLSDELEWGHLLRVEEIGLAGGSSPKLGVS